MIETILFISLPVLPWDGVALAARRRERRRKKEGAWNEHGPIDPTFAPPDPDLHAAGIRLPTIEKE